MTYKEMDEFVAVNGFDNLVHEEGKPMPQAMFETERKMKNADFIPNDSRSQTAI